MARKGLIKLILLVLPMFWQHSFTWSPLFLQHPFSNINSCQSVHTAFAVVLMTHEPCNVFTLSNSLTTLK